VLLPLVSPRPYARWMMTTRKGRPLTGKPRPWQKPRAVALLPPDELRRELAYYRERLAYTWNVPGRRGLQNRRERVKQAIAVRETALRAYWERQLAGAKCPDCGDLLRGACIVCRTSG
jgi:hypothetical protein